MTQQSDQHDVETMARNAIERGQDLAARLPKFGHVVWLYTQSPQHKHLFVQDLESRVLPGILTDQCKLYLRSGSGELPLGFASWACLSEEAEKRYIATQRIAPADWRSGDRLWLIDMVTPFGGAGDVILDLARKVHAGKTVFLFYPDENGRLVKTSLDSIVSRAVNDKDASDGSETGVPKHLDSNQDQTRH